MQFMIRFLSDPSHRMFSVRVYKTNFAKPNAKHILPYYVQKRYMNFQVFFFSFNLCAVVQSTCFSGVLKYVFLIIYNIPRKLHYNFTLICIFIMNRTVTVHIKLKVNACF